MIQMTTIQKIGKLFILFLIVAGLASCDDDSELEEFNYYGDVVLAKRMLNNTIKYSPMYYAYGNRTITSAEVSLPEGETVSLSQSSYSSATFYDLPDISDYSEDTPDFDSYTFTIVNDGIEYTTTDILENDTLISIPSIDSVSFSYNTYEEVYVEWELPDDNEPDNEPDSYLVRMVDKDYETVFTGFLLDNTQSTYKISDGWGSFDQTPIEGTIYTVEVHAFKYENDATTSDYLYNVNTVAIASEDIRWGEE